MEIGLIFLLMLGCLGIGYYLRFWHDAPELAAREEMLEQRIERLAAEKLADFTQAEARRAMGMMNDPRRSRS